jgi:hypothetical protein
MTVGIIVAQEVEVQMKRTKKKILVWPWAERKEK